MRRLIDESYSSAVAQIGTAEFDYIHRQIERKLHLTGASRISWVRKLSGYMESLYRLHGDYVTGEAELDPDTDRHIGAALFYFVNPYDIIPDHTAGTGYLDDVYVLNKCLQKINRQYPGVMAEYHPNGSE